MFNVKSFSEQKRATVASGFLKEQDEFMWGIEDEQISEEFNQHFSGLSELNLRSRRHARVFYHEILVPKLQDGEPIDSTALKSLISDYQQNNKDAHFDLQTLYGFALINGISRENRIDEEIPGFDSRAYKLAARAEDLIKILWEESSELE